MATVAFGGSRWFEGGDVPVGWLVRSCLLAGRRLAVGCCVGGDALAISAALAVPGGAAALSVFAAFGPGGEGAAGPASEVGLVLGAAAAGASVSFWAGGPAALPCAARLACRSAAVAAAAVAGGPGSAGVWLASWRPGASVAGPAFLRFSALVVAGGLPLFVFGCPSSALPALGFGSWAAAAPSGAWASGWRWLPALLRFVVGTK